MFRYSISDCFGWRFPECNSNRIAIYNLFRRFIDIDCKWCNILSVEHRSNNSEHHSESDINHYLYSDWNECKWMFGRCIGDSFGQRLAERHCNSFTRIYLPWWIQHAHSEWRNFLPMEYGSNHGKYNGKSIFNHSLLSHRDQCKRLFKGSISNGYSWFVSYSRSDSITSNDLFRWIKHIDGYRSNQLSVEYWPDDSKHYC